MSLLTSRSRGIRTAAAIALSLGVTAGIGLAIGAPASAASSGFIAAPNGMVGVSETITINAPSAKGQTVTIGLTLGASAQTLQTTIGSNGYGAVTWTPAAAGTWAINGLGTIASVGSTSLTVAPMPTYTVLLAQNAVQQGANNNILAAVVAPIGTLAPTGSVTLSTAGGAAITSGPLNGSYGASISTATLNWVPSTGGPIAIQASYSPASGGQLASTSPNSQPNSSTALPTVALRWPANLYVGTTTVLQAVIGNGLPDGSVAFLMDNIGISGSMPTTNGVASFQWSPPSSGIHTITVSYTGNKPGFSGTSSQVVNVQGARVADNITVDPPTQPVWSIAQPIIMTVGSNVTLAGTSVSGTTVLFSEQGPCVIAGATLRALGAGQCQVTATSPGSAQLTPGSETYTITVNNPPKRR
ncbi:MAG: Ig-like domain repeat protein [Actinomycetes bacterium]